MEAFNHVTILGAGAVGASWAAHFLACGKMVTAFDLADRQKAFVEAYVPNVRTRLRELGLASGAAPATVAFKVSAAEAVQDAGFVQQSVPEWLEIKHPLYREIAPHLNPSADFASSASGLLFSELHVPLV